MNLISKLAKKEKLPKVYVSLPTGQILHFLHFSEYNKNKHRGEQGRIGQVGLILHLELNIKKFYLLVLI